jgi:hypothetical protein
VLVRRRPGSSVAGRQHCGLFSAQFGFPGSSFAQFFFRFASSFFFFAFLCVFLFCFLTHCLMFRLCPAWLLHQDGGRHRVTRRLFKNSAQAQLTARKAHGGRLRQALFVVDLQLQGLRRSVEELSQLRCAEAACVPVVETSSQRVWSRGFLLQARAAFIQMPFYSTPTGLPQLTSHLPHMRESLLQGTNSLCCCYCCCIWGP